MSKTPHTRRFFYKLFYNAHIFTVIGKLYEPLGRSAFNIIARIIAFLYATTHHEVRATVQENLRLLAPAQASAMDAVRVFINFATTLSDYLCISNMPGADALALCSKHIGREHLIRANSCGTGAILATGHFGFFEYGITLLSQVNLRTCILTFPEPTNELTQWRASQRARWNTLTIPIGNDAFCSLDVITKLNQGYFCAMLADRPFNNFFLEVPLPNGRMRFSKSPALLAYLAKCPIIPVVVVKQPDSSYQLVAKDPISIDYTLPRNQAVELATSKIAESLIAEFRRYPHQWYHFIPIK